MITRDKLQELREHYKSEWLRLLQQAAAHEGAMWAIDDLLKNYGADDEPALSIEEVLNGPVNSDG